MVNYGISNAIVLEIPQFTIDTAILSNMTVKII